MMDMPTVHFGTPLCSVRTVNGTYIIQLHTNGTAYGTYKIQLHAYCRADGTNKNLFHRIARAHYTYKPQTCYDRHANRTL